MTEYNIDFYKKMSNGAEASANIILPVIFDLIRPASVLDLGCGVGCWLKVAKSLGAIKVIGFDGEYVNSKQLQILPTEFVSVDLSIGMPKIISVDLAICMEVAEHLSTEVADSIVDFLCKSSDIVLFGAAIPGQGGAHHVNEQWQSYWAQKFGNKGYLHSTKLRDYFWNDERVAIWYKQNSLIFINELRTDLVEKFNASKSYSCINIVHPDLFAMKMRRYSFLEKVLTLMQRYLNFLRSLISIKL